MVSGGLCRIRHQVKPGPLTFGRLRWSRWTLFGRKNLDGNKQCPVSTLHMTNLLPLMSTNTPPSWIVPSAHVFLGWTGLSNERNFKPTIPPPNTFALTSLTTDCFSSSLLTSFSFSSLRDRGNYTIRYYLKTWFSLDTIIIDFSLVRLWLAMSY